MWQGGHCGRDRWRGASRGVTGGGKGEGCSTFLPGRWPATRSQWVPCVMCVYFV